MMNMNEVVNFMSEDWPTGQDDLLDLDLLDDRLLFSDTSTVPLTNALAEYNNIINSFGGYEYPEQLGTTGQALSPNSSLDSDHDFHGFPNTGGIPMDDSFSSDLRRIQQTPLKQELDETMFLRSPGPPLSSSGSDSGLSSDHLDLDPNQEYEALSPALSSPGPSISERGGSNSPPHYAKPIQKQPQQPQQQLPAEPKPKPAIVPPAPKEKIHPQPQVASGQPTVAPVAIQVAAPKAKPVVYHQQSPAAKQQQQQQQLLNGGNVAKKATPPKVIVEKIQAEQQADSRNTTQLVNGKEVKIYRMATLKNGQTVGITNGIANANKKVTLQLKNGNGPSATGTVLMGKMPANGTMLPKNVVLTSTPASGGVKKIIRIQQQVQQNGRSILVPVAVQDLRTIKIVNASNLKHKSANIQLAAANLLQQSKQGLIQKNVVMSKEQLMADDGVSDMAPNSDSESFVFEDIMEQSKSVIEDYERQQKHLISDSDVDQDLDDDQDMDDIGTGLNKNGTYQKLVLTMEEKRLLAKEGISLPTSYPLTKHEERELKRIRRKIRNKISAQDSRKRKKEYVDGLEERVKQCTEENQNLLKRIKLLQSQNHDLMSQMKRLQSLLPKGTGKTTQPATCLMVLLLSMALVAVPNLKIGNSATQQNIQDSIEMSELIQEAASEKVQAQSRRSLLFDTKEQLADTVVDEEMNFDEIMSFNVNSLIASEHDYSSEADSEPPRAKKSKVAFIEYDVDDDLWNDGNKIRIKQEQLPPVAAMPDGNELFNQKAKEFQQALQSSGFYIKTEQSFDLNALSSELVLDRDLLEKMVAQNGNELYGLKVDTFADLNKPGIDITVASIGRAGNHEHDGGHGDGRKLNASQQIQQQLNNNNKRKLLL